MKYSQESTPSWQQNVLRIKHGDPCSWKKQLFVVLAFLSRDVPADGGWWKIPATDLKQFYFSLNDRYDA